MADLGITRVADISGLDRIGLPVYTAVRPNSCSISVSHGKGITRDAAVASALMEALECWHCERVEVPLVYDSYVSLRGRARTIDAARLPLREGVAFRADYPLLWAEAVALSTGQPIWVPFECVSTNFVEPTRAGSTFVASSNGLASGNHRLEAIVHGLCELIERDSHAMWRAGGGSDQTDTMVDLTTVRDVDVQWLLSQLSAAGIVAAAWDITSGTGIPAYYCEIAEHPSTPRWAPGVFAGMGCHLNGSVALSRALTEAVQSRLTHIAGSHDAMSADETQANPADVCATAELPQRAGGQVFQAVDLSTETFEDDLAELGAALARIGGGEIAVIDLTRPDIGIPVVKVVVAGLERAAT